MSLHPFAHPSAWIAAGWTMLHVGWIGAFAGIGAVILRRLLRSARPELRHGVALAILLGLVIAPTPLFLSLFQPEQMPDASVLHGGPATPLGDRDGRNAAPLPALALHDSPRAIRFKPPRAMLVVQFEPVIEYLPAVWLAGSLVTLGLVATGLVGVERLRRSSKPLEQDWLARRCRELADSLGVARRVSISVCDRIATPLLVGVVRPMIVLPAAAVCSMSPDQVEMALLHELAHIRRHDNVVILLQRLAESLLFFHPAVWWLSAWISLERELCCDRLVVKHTGRPHAYARMLATLAGVAEGSPALALAMAQRPLATRIRRILDMEDRSMKLTLTEVLGLAAAVIAATAITLVTYAKPPDNGKGDSARRELRRLSERVIAMPDGSQDYKESGQTYDGKGLALIDLARAQLRVGDPEGALATVRQVDHLAEPSPSKPGVGVDIRAWTRFAALTQSAEIRRKAGDLDGARAVLRRAARQLDILDRGAIRSAIEEVGQELNAAVAKHPAGLHRVNHEEIEVVAEASVLLIDQYIALDELERARALIRRLIDYVGPPKAPASTAFLAALGGYLAKAGDASGGRETINRARQAALALDDVKARTFALPHVAEAMFEAGGVDEALSLLQHAPVEAQTAAIGRLINQLSVDDHQIAWFDPAGIAIKIGSPSLSPKDPAHARASLPRIAAAIRASADTKAQARTLAVVAHLQARAGDFAGALITARSIPELRRSDFPGPSDGFYDAVKPVTFALIAGAQADAGDTSASVTFAQAKSLSRGIGAEDQKLIAQIAIARRLAGCARRDGALAIVGEAFPLALTQPEPRRSRVLTMLAEIQVQSGDADGARRTIDVIREYPGLEKVRALSSLARWQEETGNSAASKELLRKAVACLEKKAPKVPPPGKVMTLSSFSRDDFIDFDLELDPGMVQFQREAMLRRCLVSMGNVDAAVRRAKSLPPMGRDLALSEIAGNLASRGDVARATNLAASIESPSARLSAFVMLASTVADPRYRK
jgi:beta-lactamase regulating signal transducer with metallopeptidase domain